MHRRIKHGLAVRPSSPILSFSLSFSRLIYSRCLSMPIPHSRFPNSLTASRLIFLLLIPLRRIPIRSRCLFHYFVISPYLSFLPSCFASSFSSSPLLLNISLRFVLSYLRCSRARSHSRVTKTPKNARKTRRATSLLSETAISMFIWKQPRNLHAVSYSFVFVIN